MATNIYQNNPDYEVLSTPLGDAYRYVGGEGAATYFTAPDGRFVQQIKQEATTDWGSPTVTGYVAGDPTPVRASELGIKVDGDPLFYRYETFDAQGKSQGYSYEKAGPTSVFGNIRDVAAGILSSPIGIPLTLGATQWLAPALGAIGAGATVGAGTAAITGDNIVKGAVLGGVAGGIQDYFLPAATDAAAVDSAVKSLEDAYIAAGLPVDYGAIERSLLAQGFNSIDAGAAVDLARSTGTVTGTVPPVGQVVDVVGSRLADTSVLEALNLVPAGTFTPVVNAPTTITQAPATPTEQTVEVTGTTEQQPTVRVPPIVTRPTTTVAPSVENQTVQITQPKNLATEADIVSLYNTILGRAPDAGGLEFYKSGGFTIDEVRNDMLNSDEYKNKVTPTPTTFPTDQTVEVTGPKTDTTPVVPVVPTPTTPTTPYVPKDVEVTVPKEREGTFAPPPLPPVELPPIVPETNVTSPVVDDPNLVDIGEGPSNLPSWLTPDLLKALITLGFLGTGGTGNTGGTGSGPGALPTQGVPTPTTDYYNQVQQYYNQYMPTQPRDVATPLQTWYGGSLFNMPTNIPASPTTNTAGGMTPNIDTQAIIDFLNQYAKQQD